MTKLIDDTLQNYTYPGESGRGFIYLVAIFVVAYVGLALLDREIPHGLDILAGALVGGKYSRTFKPKTK